MRDDNCIFARTKLSSANRMRRLGGEDGSAAGGCEAAGKVSDVAAELEAADFVSDAVTSEWEFRGADEDGVAEEERCGSPASLELVTAGDAEGAVEAITAVEQVRVLALGATPASMSLP